MFGAGPDTVNQMKAHEAKTQYWEQGQKQQNKQWCLTYLHQRVWYRVIRSSPSEDEVCLSAL